MKKPSCFVATISLDLADKLEKDLLSFGFTLSKPPYSLFSGKKPGLSCTLYTSGKITVQGKDKDEFITNYLEPEILKTFDYSYPELSVDFNARIGIDEAGKGDFFGPLCVAGVQADEEQIKKLLDIGVKDSKNLSDSRIVKLAKEIQKFCPHVVVKMNPFKYNELYESFHNLNRLLAWGHGKAISELVEKTGCKKVIIDQFASEHLVENALKKMNLTLDLTQRHKAESDPVVAAASILARTAFVEGIQALGEKFSMTLPKGANNHVIEAGKAFVSRYGKEALNEVAKMHFKTKELVLK